MNKYECFYNRVTATVFAENSYSANMKALAEFTKIFPRKKIKSYDISVVFAEKPISTQYI